MIALSWRARIQAAKSNRILRAGSVLVGGTAAAQAITILALPILTRLYSPDDFQVVAVYSATLTILAAAACGRLEIAIPIPKRDSEAANLLALSSVFAIAMASACAVAIAAFGPGIARLIGWRANIAYLWLLPVGVLMSGSYAAAQYWATRRLKFTEIARTRVTQVGTGLGVQIVLGLVKVAPFGLLLGHMLTSAAGSFRLWWQVLRDDRNALAAIRPKRMAAVLRRRRRFPLYSVPESLANTAGIQLPVIMISAAVAGPEAGFLMLAMRTVGTPIAVIGSAASQVYLGDAADVERDGRLGDFTADIISGIGRIGVAPLLFAGIVAPRVFAFVFGSEWVRAGELVGWMTAWSILRLLSSPISMVMHVRMAQRAMLVLTVFGFFLRVTCVAAAGRLWSLGAVESYAVASALFYGLCYFVFAYYARMGWRHHWRVLRAALPLSSLAVICGIATTFFPS
jgi:O-antigen/teichoic acid export membrane protein